MELKIKHFDQAYELLKKYISPSPLIKNYWLSEKYNCNIYLKLENMLPVGSFKLRGAISKINSLSNEQRKQGVLAVSAGNHAQGVAMASKIFKCKSTIIMPVFSPIVKIKNSENLGAKVITKGEDLSDSMKFAKTYIKSNKKTFIHPYEDSQIIYGQGTIALELLEQLPKIDYVFTSIGGGGLTAGIGSVLKERSTKTKLIGSQAVGSNSMVQSLNKKSIVKVNDNDTFADGIKIRNPSKKLFNILKEVVDSQVSVEEFEIAKAILNLMENANILAEGAGAVPLAAFKRMYNNSPEKFHKKNVVIVVSGGNIDINLVGKIIDYGLMASRRRAVLTLILPDKPGSLSKLTGLISSSAANILKVSHDKNSSSIGIRESRVAVTIETRNGKHLEEVMKYLKKNNFNVNLQE